MRIDFRGLLSFLFVLLSTATLAQNRLSADVTTRQLNNGKSLRVEKQVFYNTNGNMVVHYTYPQEYYMVTNRLGETSVYQPDAGEVMQVNDHSMSTESEMLTIFLSPNYVDLGLNKQGFVLGKVEKEGKDQIRTYTPTHSDDKVFKKVTVVCRNGKPIFCAFYDHSGHIIKKTYYSRYVEQSIFSFPSLITQISYDTKGDSIIRREEYRNIRTKDFPKNALFDYKVPANAKRVNPYGVKK